MKGENSRRLLPPCGFGVQIKLTAKRIPQPLSPIDHNTRFAFTCGGVHPVLVEPVSPIEFTTCRIDAPQARRSCAGSFETFTRSLPNLAQP